MSSEVETRSAAIAAPWAAADPSGRTGVYRVASSTTSAGHIIPDGMRKRFIRVTAYGVNIQFALTKGAAQALVFNQASAFGTGHVAAGGTVFANSSQDFDLPDNDDTAADNVLYFNVISSDAGGFVEVYVSDKVRP